MRHDVRLSSLFEQPEALGFGALFMNTPHFAMLGAHVAVRVVRAALLRPLAEGHLFRIAERLWQHNDRRAGFHVQLIDGNEADVIPRQLHKQQESRQAPPLVHHGRTNLGNKLARARQLVNVGQYLTMFEIDVITKIVVVMIGCEAAPAAWPATATAAAAAAVWVRFEVVGVVSAAAICGVVWAR